MDFTFSFGDLPESVRSGWEQCWHLAVACLLALPIGWDREKRAYEQSAGIRTFPLVAVAACGIFLVGKGVAHGEAEPLARVIYGVMTGMGFLGGGAILKEEGHVTGLTTAASLWNTAVIGLAVGAEQFVVAVALAVANVFLLKAKHKGPASRPKRAERRGEPERSPASAEDG